MKHKHADVIIAWANGAQIQGRFNSGDVWEDIEHPSWHLKWEYRIKPEPKPDIVHRTRIIPSSLQGFGVKFDYGVSNVEFTFDGETEELKSAEVLK